MTTSPHILGVPDSAGDPFLRNLNLALQAFATLSASSAEPPVKDRCMLWFDQSTAILKMRNPSNIAWVNILRITDAGVEPLLHGDTITSISTLTTNVDGYIRALKNGTFRVEDVSSPDIPIFGIGKSGMVPGPSAAEANNGGSLRSDGAWRLGPIVLASRQFAGATDYALSNIPRSSAYRIALRAVLSNNQSLVLQVGSGGSPAQSGYRSNVSHYYVLGDGSNADDETLSSGFQFWRTYGNPAEIVVIGELVSLGGNQWVWASSGGIVTGNITADVSRGVVTLPGVLDYMRVISAGNPRGSYGNRASINSGSIQVYT